MNQELKTGVLEILPLDTEVFGIECGKLQIKDEDFSTGNLLSSVFSVQISYLLHFGGAPGLL